MTKKEKYRKSKHVCMGKRFKGSSRTALVTYYISLADAKKLSKNPEHGYSYYSLKPKLSKYCDTIGEIYTIEIDKDGKSVCSDDGFRSTDVHFDDEKMIDKAKLMSEYNVSLNEERKHISKNKKAFNSSKLQKALKNLVKVAIEIEEEHNTNTYTHIRRYIEIELYMRSLNFRLHGKKE